MLITIIVKIAYSTVNVNPNPVINISGTNTICQGDSTTLIANGASSYVWSPSNSLNHLQEILLLQTHQ